MATQQHSTTAPARTGVHTQGLWRPATSTCARVMRVGAAALVIALTSFGYGVSAAQGETGSLPLPGSANLSLSVPVYFAQTLNQAPVETRRLSNDPKAAALALFSALKRADQPDSHRERLSHLVRLYRFDCARVSDFQLFASSQNRIDLKVKCTGRPLYGVTVASNGYSAVVGGNGLISPLDRRDGLIYSFSEEGQVAGTSRRTVSGLAADTHARLVGTSSAAYYVYIGILVVIVAVMGLLAVYWLQRYLIVYRRRRYLRRLRKHRSAARVERDAASQSTALLHTEGEQPEAIDAPLLYNVPPNIDDDDYDEDTLDFDRGDGWAEGQTDFGAAEGAAAASLEQMQAKPRAAGSKAVHQKAEQSGGDSTLAAPAKTIPGKTTSRAAQPSPGPESARGLPKSTNLDTAPNSGPVSGPVGGAVGGAGEEGMGAADELAAPAYMSAPALKSARRTYSQTAPSARSAQQGGAPILGEMPSDVKTRLQMEARPVHAHLWYHGAANVYIARGPRGKRRFFARRLWAELYCRYGIRMFEMYQVHVPDMP